VEGVYKDRWLNQRENSQEHRRDRPFPPTPHPDADTACFREVTNRTRSHPPYDAHSGMGVGQPSLAEEGGDRGGRGSGRKVKNIQHRKGRVEKPSDFQGEPNDEVENSGKKREGGLRSEI